MKPSFAGHAMAGCEFAGPGEGFDRGESRSGHLPCARFAGSSARFRGIVCALLLMSLAGVAWSQKRPVDLTGMSIEDLMQVQITSVSKKQESLSRTAAAIYAITPEGWLSGDSSTGTICEAVTFFSSVRRNESVWPKSWKV